MQAYTLIFCFLKLECQFKLDSFIIGLYVNTFNIHVRSSLGAKTAISFCHVNQGPTLFLLSLQPNHGYTSVHIKKSNDLFLQVYEGKKIPWKAILLAFFLCLGGALLLVVGSLIVSGHIDAKVSCTFTCRACKTVTN